MFCKRYTVYVICLDDRDVSKVQTCFVSLMSIDQSRKVKFIDRLFDCACSPRKRFPFVEVSSACKGIYIKCVVANLLQSLAYVHILYLILDNYLELFIPCCQKKVQLGYILLKFLQCMQQNYRHYCCPI